MNKNLVGGYYLVSLDGVDLASESEIVLTDVAKLLYYAKKYKFVVFQDIVIDGEKKTATPAMFEADMTLSTKPEDWNDETDGEFVPEELYTAKIYNLYGKNIEIDADGIANVTVYETGVEPSTLFGKFVKIMNAPIDPQNLTEDEYNSFIEGVFIKGNFLGYHNPVFFPASVTSDANRVYGYMLASTGLYVYYIINQKDMGVVVDTSLIVDGASWRLNAFTSIYVQGKEIPAYPATQTDKTYVLKLVNGTLTWVEETA